MSTNYHWPPKSFSPSGITVKSIIFLDTSNFMSIHLLRKIRYQILFTKFNAGTYILLTENVCEMGLDRESRFDRVNKFLPVKVKSTWVVEFLTPRYQISYRQNRS